MLGIFCAALLTAAISVYVLHDVDKAQIGHWNEAFIGLCFEFVLFTVIIGAGVELLVLLGRYFFISEDILLVQRWLFYLVLVCR